MDLKTIAIRVSPELHQQLVLLASLAERLLVEEIREAIDTHIARRSAEVDLTAQARAALEAIDKDAANRRKAIESLMAAPKPSPTGEGTPPRRGGKRST